MRKKNEDNFLLYIPSKKHEVWEIRNDVVYLIFYHNKPIERLANWLVKKPSVTDVELDKIGSEVWKLIDGERSVYEIGQELIKCLGEQCEPVYERLIVYLRYLNRRGWTSFDRGIQQPSKGM